MPQSPIRVLTSATATSTVALAMALLVAAGLLSACSSDPVETDESEPSPTGSPAPYTAPPIAPDVNPLNGLPGGIPAEVFGVKIDDTQPARPQIGLSAADLVYVEQVEGGLTRLLSVFGTTLPPQVGPVRSVRASDAQLLAQYGPVGLAFSGGAAPQLAIVTQSPLVNGSADNNPQYYSRADGRPAPYDLVLDLPAMARDLPAAGGRSIGLLWGTYPGLAQGAPGSSLTVPVGRITQDFRYDPASDRYVRFIDGAPQFDATGPALATANVIVMFCEVGPDGVGADVNGSPTIGTSTVGTGPVSIFRNGVRIDGTWTRTSAEAGTTFTDAAGRPIRLAPGGAWTLLAANGAPLASG